MWDLEQAQLAEVVPLVTLLGKGQQVGVVEVAAVGMGLEST